MANILDKIHSAINVLKNDEQDKAEMTDAEKRMMREMCYIGDPETLKAQGTRFILPVGLVISKYARLGKNCVLYQNVTIGGKDHPNRVGNPDNYPQIGDNAIVYPGAFIIGPVKIGANCIIGANTVVVSDVPDNSMVAGNPAKIMPRG